MTPLASGIDANAAGAISHNNASVNLRISSLLESLEFVGGLATVLADEAGAQQRPVRVVLRDHRQIELKTRFVARPDRYQPEGERPKRRRARRRRVAFGGHAVGTDGDIGLRAVDTCRGAGRKFPLQRETEE